MNRKKLLAIALGVSLAATLGAAQADPLRFYLGGDVVQLTTKIDDLTGVPPIVTGSAKATTLRMKGGLQLVEWLALEVHMVVPRTETYSTAGAANKVSTSVFGLFAKPSFNAGALNIYGLVGYAGTTFDFTGVVAGQQSKSDFAYGAGVQYPFTKNVSGSIEYTQYNKTSLPVGGFAGGLDVNVSAVGVGIAYTF